MKDYNILKSYSKNIYLIRFGNFWYEENEIGDDRRVLYRACGILTMLIYGFVTVMEIMAAVMGELPEDEKSDAMTFAINHIIVIMKISSVIINKSLIRSLNRKMVEVCQNHEELKLMTKKYKNMKINVLLYVVIVYGSYVFCIFEGLRKMYSGSHFVTIVTYYPLYDDNSFVAISIRVCTTLVLFSILCSIIVTADLFTMVYIIMFKYKFITLRHYIEHLTEEVETLHHLGQINLAAEKLANGLLETIKMHDTLLKLSKEIDKAFGLVMALQLCQSSGAAVFILLQIALAVDLQFVAAAKLIIFVAALFFLLGLFLCNAGEITHEASLISDTIFYCGWWLCPPWWNNTSKRNIRQLVLMAILQAQRPLVIKAFKMLELNYEMFISVVRGTYSVFALVYAQKK